MAGKTGSPLEWRSSNNCIRSGIPGNGRWKSFAFDGDNGKLLWKVNVGTGVIAPPITYSVDGIQYISFQVGWGGSGGAMNKKATPDIFPAHIYTFRLDGKEKMPELIAMQKPVPLNIEYPGHRNRNKKRRRNLPAVLYGLPWNN